MSKLRHIHCGGHIYKDGRGHSLDVTQFYDGAVFDAVRDLPGFVEESPFSSAGVTYESHHFWVHFGARYKSGKPGRAIIVVHHGGGWEAWEAESMLAQAMETIADDRALFKLCWSLADIHRNATLSGRDAAAGEYKRAFVDGRLKKRKIRGSDRVKVWIEPEQSQAA